MLFVCAGLYFMYHTVGGWLKKICTTYQFIITKIKIFWNCLRCGGDHWFCNLHIMFGIYSLITDWCAFSFSYSVLKDMVIFVCVWFFPLNDESSFSALLFQFNSVFMRLFRDCRGIKGRTYRHTHRVLLLLEYTSDISSRSLLFIYSMRSSH